MSYLLILSVFSLAVMVAVGRIEICKTKKCELIANQFIDSIKNSTNPCDDFYDYICGSWKEKHPIPIGESFINSIQILSKNVKSQIKGILMDTRPRNSKALNKARDLFKMCKDIGTIEKNEVKPIIEMIKKLGGWPATFSGETKTWQTYYKKGYAFLEPTSLFSINLEPNLRDSKTLMITLRQPTQSLFRSLSSLTRNSKHFKEQYRKYIYNIASYFTKKTHNCAFPSHMKKFIDELIDLELNLVEISVPKEANQNIDQMYDTMTIENFQRIFYSQLKEDDSNSNMDWLDLINYLFNEVGFAIEASEFIQTPHLAYFLKLPSVLNKTEPRAIVNIMIWTLVRRTINYSDKTLIDLKNKFYSNFFKEDTEEKNREATCLEHPTLRKAISVEYVNRYFSESTKTEVKQFIDHIIKVAEETVGKSSWMDEPTREKSVEKVQAIKTLIGYPDIYTYDVIDEYYKDLQLGSNYLESMINLQKFLSLKNLAEIRTPYSKTEWRIEPTEKDASYSMTANALTITAAYLQPPIFDADRPEVLNFALVGFTAAHEIFHAFDVEGHRFDKYGNLVDWWSPRMYEVFGDIAKCFVEQFKTFVIKELSMGGPDVCINGERTLSENIADSAALQIAYDAFKKKQKETGDIDVRLVGMEDFSSDKLFFLQYGYLFCNNIKPSKLKSINEQDCHATYEARLWGTISNHKNFPSIFDCQVNSPMNPVKKCTIL
ncbi:membrane metallo-endopeptidase-like 1 [Prorops nasuta]|uniref:membrane metallo-endopeptidase-like 1 n=1 Tax=Prorops nasuta TaxID=863751 RepID=UPI0034CD9EB9